MAAAVGNPAILRPTHLGAVLTEMPGASTELFNVAEFGVNSAMIVG